MKDSNAIIREIVRCAKEVALAENTIKTIQIEHELNHIEIPETTLHTLQNNIDYCNARISALSFAIDSEFNALY